MSVTIEQATFDDIPRLNELYFSLVNSHSNINEMENTYKSIINNSDYYLLVIRKDNYIIGTGMAIIFRSLANNCKPYFVIDNVIIDEDYRYQGYGTLLFQKFDEYAKDANCQCSYLVAERNNEVACKFYKKLNFNDPITGFQKSY